MKTYLPLLILLAASLGCQAQASKATSSKTPPELSFINNKRLRHVFVMLACRDCAPISSLPYRVVATLTPAEQNRIKSIQPAVWLKLLHGDSTDFAANLLLYSLYDRSGIVLSENNNAELWRKYMKQEDLEFWNQKFKIRHSGSRRILNK